MVNDVCKMLEARGLHAFGANGSAYWRSGKDEIGYDLVFDDDEITHVGMEAEVGGSSGGDCWGAKSKDYATGEAVDTDAVIAALAAAGVIDLDTMSARDYIEVQKGVVVGGRSVGEHYGNTKRFRCVAVKVAVKSGRLELA